MPAKPKQNRVSAGRQTKRVVPANRAQGVPGRPPTSIGPRSGRLTPAAMKALRKQTP